MTNEQLHNNLLHAVTEFDRKDEARAIKANRPVNIHALSHYCKAVSKVMKYVEAGHPVRLSILNCFCGRLLDRVLKAAGEPKSTKEEAFVGGFQKLPEIE